MAGLGESFAALRLRSTLAAVAAAWLLILAAESAPHLVHHLFDVDGDDECQFLAVADHEAAVVVTVAVAPIARLRGERVEPPSNTRARTVAVRLATVRGPPAASLA